MPLTSDTERRLERRRAWLIGLALLVCYSYFYYLGGNWNVGSRDAQIMALAEEHTLAIDSHAAAHRRQGLLPRALLQR